jgi:tetratricopeptide (TPR) repeat protein
MLTTKNRDGSNPAGGQEISTLSSCNAAKLILLLALLAGCTPSGPRALIEGKRLVDEGRYPQAVEELKTATALLGGTNALAWNYLGLAYHHAGEAAEAERAYQKALALDHNLSEARYNLGCLWLEQNRVEAAKAEFTACTLGQPNVIEGFLKLGAVQLSTHEPNAAEKSFSEALRLSSRNPEALNGLGLARLQRGRFSEAAQCFDNALKQRPDYRPALLNLAILSQQYLKDRQLALEKYREYLALKPPPENAEALKATVQQLEQELNPPPPARAGAENELAQAIPRPNPPNPAAPNATRIASAPKAEPPPDPPRTAPATVARSDPSVHVPKVAPTNVIASPAHVEVANVPPEPVLKRAQDVSTATATTLATAAEPHVTTSSAPASAAGPKIGRRGFFQRVNPLNLLRSGEKTPVRPTPLAAGEEQPAGVLSPPANGAAIATRYTYKSPPKPTPGNRANAERAFAQGVQAQEAHRLPEAIQAYRLAAQLDSTLFEADYNLGLTFTQAGNLSAALAAYEDALAIQPRSLDARYNFALVLKQANYIADAVDELERIVTSYPNETRAHLALGNLYAQQLHQPARARPHYLKVLEQEPRHPQGRDIRYWLAANA